jgi:hypothetical protein
MNRTVGRVRRDIRVADRNEVPVPTSTPRRSISISTLIIPPATLAASAGVLAVGIVMTVTENEALVAALNSTTATAADVYGGQARLTIAAAVLGAGVVAMALSLGTLAVVGTIRAVAPRVQDASREPAVDDESERGLDDVDEVDGPAGDGEDEPLAGAPAVDDAAADRVLSPRAS